MVNKLVEKTIKLSLFVQIVTTLVSLNGIYVPLKPENNILKDILKIEASVQFIEAFFYIWMMFALKDLNKMTPRRYIDWFITTPAMLISTIIFFKYQEKKEKNESTIMELEPFLLENKENILKIVIYNAGMLLFGLLGETGYIDKYVSISIGFIFFYKSFELIYYEYAIHSENSKILYKILLSIWALYGVAAMFPNVPKNISYNILDVFSKNFYGLYIYYLILQLSQS